jgi:hypothetical protein
MGYWQTNEQGHSFAHGIDSDTDEAMLWGDAPADVMDAALVRIIAAFRRDLGRSPSLEELKAGLLFSAQSALEEDEERRGAKELYAYEVVSRWTWADLQNKPVSVLESSFYDATDADDARRQYEADHEAEDVDAHAIAKGLGMERSLVSIEQIEPTRGRAKLTLVQDNA